MGEGLHKTGENKKAEMVDGGWGGTQNRNRPPSVVPVFLDVQVPLPGQVVVLVVIGELGLDDVVPAGQHAFGRLLRRGQEVVLGGARPVAAHHVVRFVDW